MKELKAGRPVGLVIFTTVPWKKPREYAEALDMSHIVVIDGLAKFGKRPFFRVVDSNGSMVGQDKNLSGHIQTNVGP